jgi:uncharacterized membrane protein
MKRCLAFFLFFWAASLHGATYQLVELPALGATTNPTMAYGMNDSSGLPGSPDYEYVAGASGNGSGGQRAVRWTVSTSGVLAVLDVGLLSPYTSAVAYDVNDSGHVVGSMGNRQAFIWRSGTTPQLQAIPAPAPARCLVAYAISNQDKVVGFYSKAVLGSSVLHPGWGFGWTPSGGLQLYDGFIRTSLGSTARAVQDGGVVAGSAEVDPDGAVIAAQQAYTWSPVRLLIGAFNGEEGSGSAIAYGINDLSEVVGESEGIAFLWDGATLIGLGPGSARDINSFGEIVGLAPKAAGGTYAFFKSSSGARVDLNTLVTFPAGSGWQLAEAHAINDRGWIAGIGSRLVNGVRVSKGFVLIPQ